MAHQRRGDIQTLRGVAVLAVLAYHVWPDALTGGYVGVDVFFVISGFLITGLLVREREATGTVAIGRFWARRARRLLPAALIVAALSLIATLTIAPPSLHAPFAREIVASVLYVENWALAVDGADYLAAENRASPVQHYWSLSVEEQFYLVWPFLVVLAGSAIARRLGGVRRVITVAVTAVGTLSFAGSVALVAAGSPLAYFGTHVRAWEFAAGALVALLLADRRLPRRWAAPIAWLGVLMIVGAAVFFTADTPFPGVAALLPVLGTVAVIAADSDGSRWSVASAGSRSGLQWLGEVSYPAYLWHWPIIIFLGFAAPAALSGWGTLAVVGATLILAWLTTRFIEDPLRRRPLVSGRDTARVLVASMVAMVLVATPAAVEWRTEVAAAQAAIERAAEQAAEQERCFGAGAGVDPEGCAGLISTTLTPDPAFARDDRNDAYLDNCIGSTSDPRLRSCTYGDDDGAVRVAIIGDSHAINWFPAYQRIAEERGWSLTTHFKSACPESTAIKRNDIPEAESSCVEWNSTMATGDHVVRPYDLVVVSYSAAADSYDSREIAIDGFLGAWQKYIDDGSTIVVMADNARNTPEVIECLVRNETDPGACSVPFSTAYPRSDAMVAAAARIPDHAVVITTSDVFCAAGQCNAAIGGVVVYRDSHHLTNTFAVTLAPIIAERLDAALATLADR